MDIDKSILTFIKTSSIQDIKFGRNDAGIPYLKYIHQIHKEKLGSVCSSCPYNQDDYIRNVQSFLKNQKIMSTETKKTAKQEFQLKGGALIRHKGKSYSAHNLTDKVAKEILDQNPNRKVLFVKLPKGWKPKTSENVETEVETENVEKPTLNDRKAELEDLHWKQLEEIVEKLGHDYSLLKKDGSIKAILKAEYPEEFTKE
jgi:hypothetical protein